MNKLTGSVLGFAAAALAGMVPWAEAEEASNVPFVNEWKGVHANRETSGQIVARDLKTWQDAWKTMQGNVKPGPDTPQTDFNKNEIIAVFMGQKPSGGYAVEIVGVEKKTDKLVVKVKESSPPPDAMVTMALTSPYHVVEIPRTDLAVEFVNQAAPPKATPDNATGAAREHIRSIMLSDLARLKETYAPTVRLMPGHEFLKDQYQLAETGARARGATVDRDKLLAAMEKVSAGQPPRTGEHVGAMLETLSYTELETASGAVVTDPTDPIGSPDGKLHFTTEAGDVLLKIAPPQGDFLLLQLRRIDGQWKVVAEYID